MNHLSGGGLGSRGRRDRGGGVGREAALEATTDWARRFRARNRSTPEAVVPVQADVAGVPFDEQVARRRNIPPGVCSLLTVSARQFVVALPETVAYRQRPKLERRPYENPLATPRETADSCPGRSSSAGRFARPRYPRRRSSGNRGRPRTLTPRRSDLGVWTHNSCAGGALRRPPRTSNEGTHRDSHDDPPRG